MMLTDLRFALRQLLKNPGFTAVAVLALALGIGANTAIFSVVNAVLLKPLPFPDPNRIYAMGSQNRHEANWTSTSGLNSMSYPDFFDYRSQNHSLSHVALYADTSYSLVGQNDVKSVRGQKVSADFLDVLGVKPMMGHNFVRDDEQAGGGPGGYKVILTHGFWQRELKGDPAALGRTLTLDARPHTVIGVMPEGFQFPIQTESSDVYVTIAEDASTADGTKPSTEQRGSHSLRGLARLKPGVTPENAEKELQTIAAALAKQYPDTNTNFSVGILPLREELVGDVRTALYILFGAVLCVLLIASANVANLQLARASVRGREIAVRSALGAGRGRIIRQLLTESVLLSGIGGLFGFILAQWGTRALVAVVPQNLPLASRIELDGYVLAFTLLVALGTGVIFGLAPALGASRVDLASALKSGSRGSTSGGGHRLRHLLVVGEISLALVLLVGAGLLLQSFARLGQVSPGVQSAGLLTARFGLPETSYPKPENLIAFYDQLMAKLRLVPGVKSVSTVFPLPLSGSESITDFDIEESPKPEGQRAASPVRIIGVDYFKTMGIPVKRGRVFTDAEQLKSQPVVIVNEKFVQTYFPGQNVIGKRIKPGWSIDDDKPHMREIIGIVGNVKARSLKADEMPEIYLSGAQLPINVATLVVRSEVSDPTSLTSAITAQLATIDRGIPLTRIRVFEEYMTRSLARPRFNALLLSIFAGVALLLTAIGIYGVMAYSVAQRTGEIGLRMALGAGHSSIFRLVIGQAMTLAGISIGLGLVAAFVATRLMNSLLFGVPSWDPFTFIGISALIALVAFLAAWIPARRAMRVDPMVALRAD